jgi:hypothetical protein
VPATVLGAQAVVVGGRVEGGESGERDAGRGTRGRKHAERSCRDAGESGEWGWPRRLR